MKTLVITGRPTTKKNSPRVVRFGRFTKVLPSKKYCEYEEAALVELRKQRPTYYDGTVQVTCRYWMPDKRSSPDLVGLLQATSDILETAGILKNDKYIVSYDGSRIMGCDKKKPRVEIDIEPMDSEFWKGR